MSFAEKRADLSHWRKRLGDRPELLPEFVAYASWALRGKILARVSGSPGTRR